MSVRKTTGDHLVAAVMALATDSGTLLEHSHRRWASITFVGSRHSIRIQFDGVDALDASSLFEARLPEHEFAVPGHLVCDAGVIVSEHDFIGGAVSVTMTADILILKDD